MTRFSNVSISRAARSGDEDAIEALVVDLRAATSSHSEDPAFVEVCWTKSHDADDVYDLEIGVYDDASYDVRPEVEPHCVRFDGEYHDIIMAILSEFDVCWPAWA